MVELLTSPIEHYPDRWRDLKEIIAIVDTDILPCTPPSELVGVVPTYYTGYTCEQLGELTYDEASKYMYNELSADDILCDIHTLQHLYECMEQELNNSLIIPYNDVGGADEYTCSRWESMLGIVPDSEASVADRIFVIQVKLFQIAPYTLEKIEHILTNLVGEKDTRYEIENNVADKEFTVTLDLSSRFKSNAVEEMLDNMLPANVNLVVKVNYTIHDKLTKYTHEALSKYTHDEIRTTEL